MMVVDTCVILDVLMNDPIYGQRSLSVLEEYADGGLLIAPVSFVELAPAFLGDVNRENQFLFELGIELPNGFDTSDLPLAHAAWYRHIQKKRAGKSPRRPIADQRSFFGSAGSYTFPAMLASSLRSLSRASR